MSKGDFDAIYMSIGRRTASVREGPTNDVYDVFSNLVSADLGSGAANNWEMAGDRTFVLGAAVDPDLLGKGDTAPRKSVAVLSQGAFEANPAAIGRITASAPEGQTIDAFPFHAADGRMSRCQRARPMTSTMFPPTS